MREEEEEAEDSLLTSRRVGWSGPPVKAGDGATAGSRQVTNGGVSIGSRSRCALGRRGAGQSMYLDGQDAAKEDLRSCSSILHHHGQSAAASVGRMEGWKDERDAKLCGLIFSKAVDTSRI